LTTLLGPASAVGVGVALVDVELELALEDDLWCLELEDDELDDHVEELELLVDVSAGGVQLCVGFGLQVVVGGEGEGLGAEPKNQFTFIDPTESGAKNVKRPSVKSQPDPQDSHRSTTVAVVDLPPYSIVMVLPQLPWN